VAERVRRGGHHVPEEDVRRRFLRGLCNFFDLYQPLAETWILYDATTPPPSIIAVGAEGRLQVVDLERFAVVNRMRNADA
jgi:predicted ABC-type ATPase